MTTPSQLLFSDDRAAAVEALASVSKGRGWCNVMPEVVDDVPDLKVNVFGFWSSPGVPVASYVTAAPKRGEVLPSSLGLLHSRGRLGRERITLLLGGAPFAIRQDQRQRGLLLDVPADAPAAQVLYVMCTMAESLCEFEMTGRWRLDLYRRS